MEQIEVLISSETTGQLWTSSVWDVHSGTSLMTYRGGGVSAPKSLCLLGGDYILSAERTKPILHVWPLNSHERVQGYRLVLPGRATALTASPDGLYIVAGIEEKIYVWQTSSGSLLHIATGHYQTVNNLRFCDDGSHFISAGEDGLVLVWSLRGLVTAPGIDVTSQTDTDPVYAFSDHALPVRDIHVSSGGLRSRLVTVSADRTCKIYDLSCGELLLNIVFDKSLSAVTMDTTETNVFVGTTEGDIYHFSLCDPPRTREFTFDDSAKNDRFLGHTKAVTSLSCSLGGDTLVSGSNDENVIVWNVASKQKVLAIPHKGAVTAAFFTIAPRNMFGTTFEPSVVLHSLQRTVDTDGEIEILDTEPNDFWEGYETKSAEQFFAGSSISSEKCEDKLRTEVNKLKQINTKLYTFAVDRLFQNVEKVE